MDEKARMKSRSIPPHPSPPTFIPSSQPLQHQALTVILVAIHFPKCGQSDRIRTHSTRWQSGFELIETIIRNILQLQVLTIHQSHIIISVPRNEVTRPNLTQQCAICNEIVNVLLLSNVCKALEELRESWAVCFLMDVEALQLMIQALSVTIGVGEA